MLFQQVFGDGYGDSIMCGIIGYAGKRPAKPILLNGLEKLEYRGYDSCGLAFNNPHLKIYKDVVRVSELKKSIPDSPATIGIGHTRWATHGAAIALNAHPLTDCRNRISVVHNGVITNYHSLKSQLISEGHVFKSETDSEVIAHLIEKQLPEEQLVSEYNTLEAVSSALEVIKGSYALIVIVEGLPGLIFARRECPLIVGLGDGENFIASDVTAVLDNTNRVVYLEDGDMGIVRSQEIHIFNGDKTVTRNIQNVLWDSKKSQKNGYEHFMLKEIHEQPRAIRETVAGYLNSPISASDLIGSQTQNPLLIVASGSSFHAALIGKYFGEAMLTVPIRVETASEFNYLDQIPDFKLVLGISQSGETADTLKAMKRLKANHSHVLALTNVPGSSASRIADDTLYTKAWPEISVAATKSFTAEIAALYLIIASVFNKDSRQYNNLLTQLRQLPEKIQLVFEKENAIREAADKTAEYEHLFYVGRGINLPVAMEGALKLKEIAYIHAEACAAGELKHGSFALLGPETPVVTLVAPDNSHKTMMTSIKEIKARSAPVLAIASENDTDVRELADMTITVPSVDNLFSPFINAVVVQLLAYYAARKRGCPIDFPRNLAKSVTVE